MKKLMIAAAAGIAVGGAFADPLVYDYKASIKQMNLRAKTVTINRTKYYAYVKYQSTAALKGYLIHDADGATSITIQELAGTGNSVPASRPQDYGRNTAFLVVQNSKAEKDVRAPKILPAVLEGKWIDDSFGNKSNGLAEGYLYVGGDVVAGQIRESLDLYNGVLTLGATTFAPRTPAKGFISDYAWTSIWLFGMYNGPLFFDTHSWDYAQAATFAAQPADLVDAATTAAPFANGTYYYHDTWMNGAGLGKWSSAKLSRPCCGARGTASKTLDSLNGHLKGGIYLCTENGTDADGGYVPLPGALCWEDQFVTVRWDSTPANPGTYLAAGDFDQADLWQDGDLELNTSDIISGTWSIKFTSKLKPVAFTKDELVTGLGAAGDTEDAAGLKLLMANIKGAALALDKNVLLCKDAKEIWDFANAYHSEKVPFITPQFCKYYGLFNWK